MNVQECERVKELPRSEPGETLGREYIPGPSYHITRGDTWCSDGRGNPVEALPLCPENESDLEPFHFDLDSAREYEVDEGLVDLPARCYDPSLGRWLDDFPLGFEAGDTNLYRYHHPAQGQLLTEE